jgi:hypothetical protein
MDCQLLFHVFPSVYPTSLPLKISMIWQQPPYILLLDVCLVFRSGRRLDPPGSACIFIVNLIRRSSSGFCFQFCWPSLRFSRSVVPYKASVTIWETDSYSSLNFDICTACIVIFSICIMLALLEYILSRANPTRRTFPQFDQ